MPVHEYRELKPTPEAEAIYRRWLANLNEEFTRHQSPDRRSEIVAMSSFSSTSVTPTARAATRPSTANSPCTP